SRLSFLIRLICTLFFFSFIFLLTSSSLSTPYTFLMRLNILLAFAAFSVWMLMTHHPTKCRRAPFILINADSQLLLQHVSTSILVNSYFMSEANDMQSRP